MKYTILLLIGIPILIFLYALVIEEVRSWFKK
jgi:hypothetical protein